MTVGSARSYFSLLPLTTKIFIAFKLKVNLDRIIKGYL
ncbi:hypothetical protein L3N51_00420 [Metallosphaera sp. J1]|nr:hypothetical protein [Metallosphaera javensis (ex Hofmann et al. 2022)]